MSERSKLTQKEYKTTHDWVEKVTHRELCKKLKFDHTNKWCMHIPESVLENEIQTDQLISARRPNLVIVNKKREPAK